MFILKVINAMTKCTREVWSSNPGRLPTLQTVRHRFNIYSSSCVALALCRGIRHRKLVTRFGKFYSSLKKCFFLLLLCKR